MVAVMVHDGVLVVQLTPMELMTPMELIPVCLAPVEVATVDPDKLVAPGVVDNPPE